MKRITFILLAAAVAMSVSGKDVIVLNNGDLIDAKVIEVDKAEVKYKKASNPKGPTYTIDKADIIAINYQNGDKDVFNQVNAKGEAQPSGLISQPVGRIDPVIAEDNQKLIDYYNSSTIKHKTKTPNQKKLKLTDYAIVCLGVTPESQLSDSNVEISWCFNNTFNSVREDVFGKSFYSYDYISAWLYRKEYEPNYRICVSNKTDGFIYIDCQRCFRIDKDGNSEPFYNGTSVTNNTGKNSGGGLSLGAVSSVLGVGGVLGTLANGINVGGGKNNSISVTELSERILVIPPHAKAYLPQRIILNNDKTKSTKNYEVVVYDTDFITYPKIEKWRYVSLQNEYAKLATNYLITYSTAQDFSTFTSLTFGVFPKGMLGANMDNKNIISDNDPPMIGPCVSIGN